MTNKSHLMIFLIIIGFFQLQAKYTPTLEPPIFATCPDDIQLTFTPTTGCDLSATWELPTLEGTAQGVTISSNFNPGDNFPIGRTTVIYTATDASGSISTCSFDVVVTGSDPITFDNCPGNIVVNALQGECGVDVDWGATPIAMDGCQPLTLVGNFQQGDYFQVGTTIVEYVATDIIDQRAVCSFSIQVIDDQPMEVFCPGSIEIDANGVVINDETNFIQSVTTNGCGNYSLEFNDIMINDNCTGMIEQDIIKGLSATNTYGFGSTPIIVNISNGINEFNTCSFEINIKAPPAVTVTTASPSACAGATLELLAEVDGSIYDVWEWTGPNGFTSNERNPSIPSLTNQMGGLYTVSASSSISNCTASGVTTLTVVDKPSTPNVSLSRAIICEGESLFFSGDAVSSGATHVWSGPNGFTSTQLEVNIPNALGEHSGTYQLIRTVNGCDSDPARVDVAVLTEPALNDDVINVPLNNTTEFDILLNDSLLQAPYTFTLLPNTLRGIVVDEGNGVLSYTPVSNFVGVEQISYEICYDECPNLCSVGIVTLRTDLPRDECLGTSVISPNGDGLNETLYISCIGDNPTEGGIMVFNQWGAKVYESFPYRNDWAGTYQGQNLPDGTYFYIFKSTDDDTMPMKNFFTIFR